MYGEKMKFFCAKDRVSFEVASPEQISVDASKEGNRKKYRAKHTCGTYSYRFLGRMKGSKTKVPKERQPSAYNVYVKEQFAKGNKSIPEIAKLWAKLSDEEKAKFKPKPVQVEATPSSS